MFTDFPGLATMYMRIIAVFDLLSVAYLYAGLLLLTCLILSKPANGAFSNCIKMFLSDIPCRWFI